ncbi:MAG: hypothetical protein JW793_04875 [Acidobacteria bacterium]|nr:hypothetical protein [Acidobacteriota bacterium]
MADASFVCFRIPIRLLPNADCLENPCNALLPLAEFIPSPHSQGIQVVSYSTPGGRAAALEIIREIHAAIARENTVLRAWFTRKTGEDGDGQNN